MSKEISTNIQINATVELIWRELINFKSYPEWNPFIHHIDGELALGSYLSILVCQPDAKSKRFKSKVRELEEMKWLVWRDCVLFPRMFEGENCFELIPLSKKSTLFVQNKRFSGWLIPIFWPRLSKNTQQGFENMNKALKIRCEEKQNICHI